MPVETASPGRAIAELLLDNVRKLCAEIRTTAGTKSGPRLSPYSAGIDLQLRVCVSTGKGLQERAPSQRDGSTPFLLPFPSSMLSSPATLWPGIEQVSSAQGIRRQCLPYFSLVH
jgi:hypothetical protein